MRRWFQPLKGAPSSATCHSDGARLRRAVAANAGGASGASIADELGLQSKTPAPLASLRSKWRSTGSHPTICQRDAGGTLPILEHAVLWLVRAEVLRLENHGALFALLRVEELLRLLRRHLHHARVVLLFG